MEIICQVCKTKIEVIDRFKKSDSTNNSFHKPCASCENRYFESDEMPCLFCSKKPLEIIEED